MYGNLKTVNSPSVLSTSFLAISILYLQAYPSLGIQFMGRSISFDWHFRSQILPPFKETLDLSTALNNSSNESLQLKFVAFGKRWTVDLNPNNLLLTDRSTITFRDIKGRQLQILNTESDCYYVGTGRADDSEYGMVSLSTCGNEVHGMINTNINDYIIFEKGWKGARKKRSLHHKILDLRMASTEEYERHVNIPLGINISKAQDSGDPRPKFHHNRKKRDVHVETPKFYRLEPPAGRTLYLELGIFVDQSFMDDFKDMVYDSPNQLIQQILLSFNNAQLWYLHPTLGFNIWLTIKDLILIDEDLPLSSDISKVSNPAYLCNWITETFPDNKLWDEIIILSSKPDIWGGRVGLAQRAGACSRHGNDRCAGVSHVNFQMASFARLIAHEAMHPLGVGDDYIGRTSRLCYSGIMRRGVWQDHDWSLCSVQEFERWAGAKISDCLSRRKTPSISGRATPLIPVNIAWRSNTIQSTTYKSEEEWGAWKATDGPITGVPSNGDARYGSCTHTVRQNKPWIRVELDRKYIGVAIDTVVVFNRDDCCDERLGNFEVRVGNDSNFRNNPLCYYHKQRVSGGRNGAAVISCEKPLSGKYVSIQLQDPNAILTVCEIQVLAKVALENFSYRENDCYDMDGFCPYWQSVGECERKSQASYMSENCAYSCGVCRRPNNRPGALNLPSKNTILSVTESPGRNCKDTHDSCMHYAANGDCKVDIETMKRCPKSCGLCTLPERNNSRVLMSRTKLATIKSERTTSSIVTVRQFATKQAVTGSTPPTEKSILRPTALSDNDENVKSENHMSPPTLLAIGSTSTAPTITSTTRTRLTAKSTTVVSSKPTTTLSEEANKLENQKQPTSASKHSGYMACKDSKTSCEGWKNIGYCSTSSVVATLCPKSCGRCRQVTTTQSASATHRPVLTANPMISTNSRPITLITKSNSLLNILTGTTRKVTNVTSYAATGPSSISKADRHFSPATSTVTTVSVDTTHMPATTTATTSATFSVTNTVSTLAKVVNKPSSAAANNLILNSKPELLALHSETACDDNLPSLCHIWRNQDQCKTQSVRRICRQTCGLCAEPIYLHSEITQPIRNRSEIKDALTNQSKVTSDQATGTVESIPLATPTKTPKVTRYTLSTPEVTHHITSAPCVDNRWECQAWAKNGHCSISSVRDQCSASCNSCRESHSFTTAQPLTSPTRSSVTCSDSVYACSVWAERGLCQRQNVATACKSSCNTCSHDL